MKQYTLKYFDDLTDYLKRNDLALIKCDHDNVKQLRSCQAWIIPVILMDSNGNHLRGHLLQSYHTIVSICYYTDPVISKADVLTQRLGRWSTTTSKQQSWFERGYWD